MLSDPFPERIDPRKLFTRNGSISGAITLERLPRLSEYLSNNKGSSQASLHFGRDPNNRRLVSGPVKAEVHMLCQRCLKEMAVSLDSALNVLVLSGKQWNDDVLKSLPDELEAVHASEDELDVIALIEDELILSLPAVVYHEEQSCNEELNKLKASTAVIEDESTVKAFAGLQALKDKLNED